ncbi:MAG TPA: zinc-ribbon domain-containing protein [Candidatus Dormibacteraeota bacterium]|jgi:hypothetical protein|nr:zinc-ribbon domain-containing protein [Candidatus Dormibacteraeota bacterium]
MSMLKIGSPKTIGTPVRCPNCRHHNLAIDIWCERCGRPLDWKPTDSARPVAARPAPPIAQPPASASARELLQAPEPPEAPDAPAAPPPARRPTGLVDAGRRQYCWSCGVPNEPDDRFCSECGKALGGVAASAGARTERRQAAGPALPRLALPTIALPRLRVPKVHFPTWRLPRISVSHIRPPIVPRTVLVVGLVLVALLIVPLAYLLFPGHSSVASRQTAGARLASTSGTHPKAGTPQAVAIAAVEAKTGLKNSAKCAGSSACLSITGQTMGQGAAAIVFSTAQTGGRQCVSYLVQRSGAWQLLDPVVCALPGQVSPLVGHDAAVHVPGNCANVRDGASLKGGVVACLRDGTTVHVDGGPAYADGLIWWHTSTGWMAHAFLVAP